MKENKLVSYSIIFSNVFIFLIVILLPSNKEFVTENLLLVIIWLTSYFFIKDIMIELDVFKKQELRNDT